MAEIQTTADGSAFGLEPWQCPTCGPGPMRFVGWRGGEHHRYGLGLASRVVRCRRCGLMFCDPFPVPVAPAELYGDPERYFAGHDPEPAELAWNRSIVDGIVARTGSARPTVLDVGSGRGELLRAAVDAGLEPVGLELSPAMVDYARENHDVSVLAETIEEHAARVGAARYDAVVLNAILEHVVHPDSFMGAVSALTRPSGILYLDVPNEPSLGTVVANVVGRRSRTAYNLSPTFPPFHVYGFGRRALAALLGKHGFTITERRVWASPKVRARRGIADRAKATAATAVRTVANWTGTASNQTVWARRS